MQHIARPHWLPALVGIALVGCLGSPAPRSCADYPPGTPGCDDDPDGGSADRGPVSDGAPDGPPGDPDTGPAPDGGHALDMSPDPDAGPDPDGAPPPDSGPAPDGALDPDAGPGPDRGPDPGPCADAPCGPAPPDRCLNDTVLTHRAARCQPTACAPDDPACDPIVLECSAMVACELDCIFDGGEDGCTAACRAGASDGARARYEAVGACTEASGCDEGGGGLFECALAECADEVRACLGTDDFVWFRRQRDAGYACDYPIDVAEACPDGQACAEGVCVDVPASCDEVLCDAPPATRCASAFDLRTFEAPGACSDESGTPTCTYPESLSQCRPGTLCSDGRCYEPDCRPTCDGRVLASCFQDGSPRDVPCTREQRCVDGGCEALPDVYGTACRQQAETVACQAAGLACGGLAAVPVCLIRGAPGMNGDPCYTDTDCEPDLRCSLAGVCQTGARGDPCLDALDCGPLLRCRRGTCG